MDVLVFFVRTLILVFGWLGSLVLAFYSIFTVDDLIGSHTNSTLLQIMVAVFQLSLMMAFWAMMAIWYLGL